METRWNDPQGVRQVAVDHELRALTNEMWFLEKHRKASEPCSEWRTHIANSAVRASDGQRSLIRHMWTNLIRECQASDKQFGEDLSTREVRRKISKDDRSLGYIAGVQRSDNKRVCGIQSAKKFGNNIKKYYFVLVICISYLYSCSKYWYILCLSIARLAAVW